MYAAFVAAPAYALNQGVIDRVYTTTIHPTIAKVAGQAAALERTVAAAAGGNALIIAGAGGALFLYTFWSLLSLPGLLTTASLGLVCYERLKQFGNGNGAGAAGSAGGAAGSPTVAPVTSSSSHSE